MARLPQISGKRIIKALEKIGYVVVRQKGSHIRLMHDTKSSVTVPNHSVVGKGLLRKIISEAELNVDEFVKLVKE